MIAMPHLVFLSILFTAGLLAWILDLAHWDTPTAVAGTIVAGLGAGVFLAAWAA